MSQTEKALVVGGSSGMGYAIAARLLRQGTAVELVARSTDRLTAATQALSELGKVSFFAADISSQAGRDDLIHHINQSSDHFKYLVNAAGYFNPKPFLEHTVEDYDVYMKLNKGTFFITQAVANNMKRYGAGAVVNIGSMWAHQSIKATPSSAYSMAKAGLHSLTQNLAMELADHHIRVNAVAPAVVKTPIYEAFIDPKELDSALASFNDFHPIGRIGSADDIANTVVHLLSDDTSWVTGAVWDIDGGVMAGRN